MIPTSMLASWRSRRAETLSQSDEAYRRLKELIVTLALPPASPIDESQLMADLGLGRTPIREALQRLSRDSLVVILPRRGTIVADLNMSDVQKIFELRLELEAMAARLAAQRATPSQIAEMEALFADAEDLLKSGDNKALIRLDHTAHLLLAQAAHNEFLEDTLDWLYSHVLRYLSLDRVKGLSDAVEEHRTIIALVKAGDGEGAAQLMHRHVATFQEQILALR
jgi:DNA-binding GntR family transcriptional regulator